MSVFGSLFTGVGALTAQSQSLAMISNNIANVNTVGFKRTDAAFSSLVTGSSRSSLFSPGSVRAFQNARIDQQGILQQSASTTDVAISGNGFFVVKRVVSDLAEPLYTRAGSFSENAQGILTNTAGLALYGWPLDQNGGIPSNAADIGSLVPVDVAFLGGLTQPTSTMELALNLNAQQTPATYPVATSETIDFTRNVTVFDSLGQAQELTVNFIKHQTPSAQVPGSVDLDAAGAVGVPLDGILGISNGDTFTIEATTSGVAPTTITIDAGETIGDIISEINAIVDTGGNPVFFATLDANNQLDIKVRDNADGDLTLEDTGGSVLQALLGTTAATMDTNPKTFAAPTAPTTLAAPNGVINTEGWWQMEVTTSTGTQITVGSLNFSGDGTLNAALDANGETIVSLSNINFGNGSALQDIEFNITAFSQFAGENNVIFSRQNGAELGLRTGVTIDRDGFVIAQFSNGATTQIYKLPIATFSNANGLDEQTGNAFRESDESGTFNLREAGTGSAGLVEGSTLEGSNVDLADEFAKMIVTQRAYSAGTKVINTADEMTAELLRLR